VTERPASEEAGYANQTKLKTEQTWASVLRYNPAMFCPLCKAEYREDFTSCSDCHLALCSENEARATPTMIFSRSSNEKGVIAVAAALDEAGIPFRFASEIKSVNGPLNIILRRRAAFTLWAKVTILEKDFERAQGVAAYEDETQAPSEPEAQGSFAKRKWSLQAGSALFVLGIILLRWANLFEMSSYDRSSTFEDAQAGAFLLLSVVGHVARLCCVPLLGMAWHARFDKLGRISLLFLLWSLFTLIAGFAGSVARW